MNKIKQKIRSSFNNIKLPDFDMDSLQNRKGMIYVKKENKTHKSKKNLLIGISTCLAVCVCLFVGLGYFNSNLKVTSTVAIDVNPSIELKINKHEKVLDVIPINDDAKIVLEGMDLKGSDIKVAVNALIGSMVKNGFIDELANSILISVDNPDSKESERLRQKIVNELNAFINSGNNISVVSQTLTNESSKAALAEQYGISLGKLELIEELIAKNNLYTYEELKDLSINELNLLLGSTTENVTTSGTASDKAYIGSEKALAIAYNNAKINASSAIAPKVEMDYEDGLMVYEVEFYYNNKEYEYEIDAVTGAIVKAKNEYDDDARIPASNNTSSNNTTSSNSNSYQGTTTVDTKGITSTLNTYSNEAKDIQNSINNLTIPSNRGEVIRLYFEWKRKIETIEDKLDRYEDELERMYYNNQLSYSDYKTFDRDLESVEDLLDKAEDTLEYRTNYDD